MTTLVLGPSLGTSAAALWGDCAALLRDELPPEDAVRLLVIADRFAYSRAVPAMRWQLAVEDAERVVPGVLSRIEAEYAERRGPVLLDEARAVVERLFG